MIFAQALLKNKSFLKWIHSLCLWLLSPLGCCDAYGCACQDNCECMVLTNTCLRTVPVICALTFSWSFLRFSLFDLLLVSLLLFFFKSNQQNILMIMNYFRKSITNGKYACFLYTYIRQYLLSFKAVCSRGPHTYKWFSYMVNYVIFVMKQNNRSQIILISQANQNINQKIKQKNPNTEM